MLTYLRKQLGFALFFVCHKCVINVSKRGGLCSDMAFFQSKDNIFMVGMQFFGSLELMLLHEKVADSGGIATSCTKGGA